jgi:hypothetical protein
MNKFTIAVAGAALIVLGTAGAPARADCASDIAKVEADMKEVGSARAADRMLDQVRGILDKERKLVGKKKKRKKCNKMVGNAQKIVKKLIDKNI